MNLVVFGATGLLSFGHALFLGIGAYVAAALTSKLGVRHFEAILLASAAALQVVGFFAIRRFSQVVE